MDDLRNENQNSRFHAAIRDISRQAKWMGLEWDEASWKALFLGAKYGQTVGPNPFGHGILIMNNKRSSKLKKAEMSELLSEIMAWGDSNGVLFTDEESISMRAYG